MRQSFSTFPGLDSPYGLPSVVFRASSQPCLGPKLYRLGEVGAGFHPELTGREPKGLPPVRTKSISSGKFTT